MSTVPDREIGHVRRLGLFDSTMIMAGIVIGSGVFLTTGIMAKTLPSSGRILGARITGGLLTLAVVGLTVIGIPFYFFWRKMNPEPDRGGIRA